MAQTLVNNPTTVKNYGNSGNAYTFTQEVIQNATGDPATNKTSITVNLYIQGINGYSYNGFTTPKAAIYIQGTKMKEVVVGAVTTSKVKYCSIDYDLPHLDDGTQTLKVKTTYNPNTTSYSYLPASYSYESTTTMTAIPRKSTMSLSSTSITTLGSTTATITTRNANFTHTITTYYYGSYTLASDKTGVSPTATITIPAGLRQKMAQNGVSSATLTLSLNTYNGSTLLGTNDYSLSISAPDPVITVSPASVRCNSATTTWTLTNYDTYLLNYAVTRTCGSKSYTDLARTEGFISTRSSLDNALFEQALPNNTKGTVTVSVTSYIKNTSTAVKTVTKTYEVTIPTGTYKPTITPVGTGLTVRQITSHGTRSGITYFAGLDGASGVVSESITGSSQIDTRSVTISYSGISTTETVGEHSVSGSNVTIYAPSSTKAWPASASDYTATVTYAVTDKRGTTASYSFTAVTVSGYYRPVIDASVERATSAGVADPEGTYANVMANARTTASTGGTIKKIEAKVEDTTSIASVDNSNTLSAKPAAGTYLTNTEYSIDIIATDDINITTTITLTLPKIAVALSLHKNNGVGLGTVATPNIITAGLPLHMKQNVYAYAPIYVGPFTMNNNNYIQVTSNNGAIRLYSSGASGGVKGLDFDDSNNVSHEILYVGRNNKVYFKGNADTATSATSATTATKLGSSTVGSSTLPIYLNAGTPTPTVDFLPLAGGTATGQIKTSYKESVAMGSYGTRQQTLSNFCNEVRFSSGCMGSISITTAVTANNVTIPTSWYNFIYTPHRSGGVNGAASDDNCNYGTLLLFGMTSNSRAFKVRISGSSPYYNDVSEIMLFNQKNSRTDTYMLAGLSGTAVSTTQIRIQIPVPDGYTNFSVALVDGNTTANLDYNGTDASFTFSSVAKLDKNPASVSIVLTTSGLTAYRVYGFRNGRVSITLT